MKAKRQTEAVLNSVTMLDGFGGHVMHTVVSAEGVGHLSGGTIRAELD